MPINNPVNLEHDGFRSPVQIHPDDIHWDAVGEEDPLTKLLARVRIGNTSHHLEAREIRHGENGPEPVEYPEDWDRIIELGGEPPTNFLVIGERSYLLFMTPYC